MDKSDKKVLMSSYIKNMKFNGIFGLILLIFIGIVLNILVEVCIYYSLLPTFGINIIDTLGDSCLTAGLLDIVLSFSNLQDILIESNKVQAKEICKYVDKQHGKSFFDGRIAHSESILASGNVVEQSMELSEKEAEAITKKLQSELKHYSTVLAGYADVCTDPLVYISEFRRKVILSKGKNDGFIEVRTITDITYVNLTETPYDAEQHPQFFRFNGSGPSYEILCFKVDGEDITRACLKNVETPSWGILSPPYGVNFP